MKEEPGTTPAGKFHAPHSAELNTLLPAYEVRELIACGGMGAVYYARQKSLDRNVAIKILPPELGANPQFRTSFESEAKAMARLNHPNLVGVYDFGQVDDYLYIIMEMVNGKSLFHSAHGKAIEQKRVAHLVHGICQGLAHAHQAGIIHRDIKPANILLGSNKQPKIGDFGLARPADSDLSGGMHFGTPEYVAPEVMEGAERADKRSDVFAVGVILYELLTGALPGENYVPPSQIQKVDPRFDKLVRRAMHPAPTMRFADAGEMAKEVSALKDALEKPGKGLLTAASSGTKLTTGSADTKSTPALAAAMATPSSSGHQQSLVRNLVIIVVLLVAIAIMWGAYNRKKEENARKQDLVEPAKVIPAATENKEIPPPRDRPKPPARSEPPDPEPEQALTLSRLKQSLARGDRSRFPEGTRECGEASVFFVDEPMSWRMASEFAEEHGAHLATLPGEAEKASLSSLVPSGVTVWLGGGSAGPSTWAWVDGSPWALPDNPSQGSGPYLALPGSGAIHSAPGGTEYPFFIQWRLSAENSGSLEAQFKRLKDSAGQAHPLFPPGTLSLQGRRYFIEARTVTWEEANDLARKVDGHLAVPSEKSESEFLQRELTNFLPKDGVAWIGGHFQSGSWTWTTGERWTFDSWIPKSRNDLDPKDTAVCIVPGERGGWDNADPDDDLCAAAFVIEWSKDRFARPETAPPKPSADWTSLRKEAAARIARNRQKHAQLILQNGTSMNRELETWYNDLDRRIRGRYFNPVQAARQKILESGRIDEKGRFPPLPAGIGDRCNAHLANQRKLDAQYQQSLEELRKDYLTTMTKSLRTAHTDRLLDQIDAIEEEIDAIGQDGESFLEHLSPDQPDG